MRSLLLLAVIILPFFAAKAVVILNGSSETSQTNVPVGVPGWNYVGIVNDSSGVYLGDGWVISAQHIAQPQVFTLDGVDYDILRTTNFGATDLRMFQISDVNGLPNLPTLAISLTLPVPNTDDVVLIGYGGGAGRSWGINSVGGINVDDLEGWEDTLYFYTVTGSNNHTVAVKGDSGGAGFIQKDGQWELAGIMCLVNTEVIDGARLDYIYLAQLSEYAEKINEIRGYSIIPEPSVWALAGGCGALLLLFRRRKS